MIINCTKHNISVVLDDGSVRNFPPSGFVIEAKSLEREAVSTDGIPTIVRDFGPISTTFGKDGFTRHDILLVSSLVLEAAKVYPTAFNKQLRAPDSGPTAIRNEKGQVTAVRRLVNL